MKKLFIFISSIYLLTEAGVYFFRTSPDTCISNNNWDYYFFCRLANKINKQFSKQPKYIADKIRKYRNEWKIDNKIKHSNYTKPNLRKKLFMEIKARNTHGTAAGKWSARKAQLLAKKYKTLGGGYY